MKKLLTLLMTTLMVSSVFAGDFADGLPAGGDGSEGDPYKIADAADLEQVRSTVINKYYQLTQDIDMTAVADFTPLLSSGQTYFRGHFDGNGYVIKNLTVNKVGTNTSTPVGFFGATTTGSVKNLGFQNLTVDGGTFKIVGGIAGRVNSTTPVTSFNECYVDTATIKGTSVGVGGIIGKINNAAGCVVKNCFVNATITGTSAAGGIVGTTTKANSVPENCVFYGTVAGTTHVGPIVGNPTVAMAINSCYYDENFGTIKGNASSKPTAQPTSLTTAQLPVQGSYTDLDFANTWAMSGDKAVLQYHPDAIAVASTTSTITYMNMGMVDNSNNPATYTDLAAVALSVPAGDSTGYAFSGWYADMALTSAVNEPALPVGTIADTTFYAKWTAVVVSNITYENMETVANANNPATYNDVEDVTLVAPSGDSIGYVFVGWFTDEVLTIPVTIPAIATGTTGDKVFYAKWQGEFTITAIAWSDGGTAEQPTVQNSLDSIKISYVNAGVNDSIYFVITAKYVGTHGQWNNTISNYKVHCPSGQDSVFATFTVHPFNTETLDGANVYRLYLTENGGVTWADRYDIGSDGSGGNDAVYGSVIENYATGTKSIEASKIDVYPNPSQGLFNIELNEEASLAVFNLAGQMVFTQRAASGTNVMDLSTLESGLFLLTVKGESTSETIKLQVR